MSNLFSLSYSNKKNPANLWDEKTIAYIILSLDEARHIFVTNKGKLQEVIGSFGPQSIVVLQYWGCSMSQVAGSNNSYKPITNTAWVRARYCKLQKGCTRLAAASDKVYQLLVHGRWFSPGIQSSSTTKTGRHDIAEILLKVALKHQKSKINQSYSIVSRRKTAKTNHRMKPYSKCLQKGNDHDRKTLPLHDM